MVTDILFDNYVLEKNKIINKNSSIIEYSVLQAGYNGLLQHILIDYQISYQNLEFFKHLQIDDKVIIVENIFIQEKERRKGLGRSFLNKVKEIAKEKEVRQIYLIAQIFNNEFYSVDFYENNGFNVIENLSDDKILMSFQ